MNETSPWEREALAAAFKIIPVLDEMPLNQAREALRLAETWLLQTHRVDANNRELRNAAREYECVPTKSA